MTPAAPFLKNPYLLWLTAAVLLVAGVSSLNSLPRLEDPRITNRFPSIIAAFPGADAARVEALLTEPIEDALEEIPEIKSVVSESRAGVAAVTPELDDAVGERDSREIFGRIRDRLAAVDLPPGTLRPDFEDLRGASTWTLIVSLADPVADDTDLGVNGSRATPGGESAALNRLTRLSGALADRLRDLPGTELVRLYGEPEEELTVTADPDELAALGLTPAAVAAAVAGADAKRPAGTVRGGGANRDLEVAGGFTAAERVAAVPLFSEGGNVVRVGDVAEVAWGFRDPPGSAATADGRRAVFVAARVAVTKRVDEWAERAKAEVAAFADDAGAAADVGLVYDESFYTNARLAELAGNLLAGAAVIALVVLCMMGRRAALIVCAALPLVCGGTLFCIGLTGGSLHQMSIFGLIIALGLLIDNAIVVTDEVRGRLSAGLSRTDAVADATRHLSAPLAASTFTTALAFAPIVLLDGNIGDFVGPIGASVIFAVAGSFAVALTLTAALAGKYLPGGQPRRPGWRGFLRRGVDFPKLAAGYHVILKAGARRPWIALAFSLMLPACGAAAATQLGQQFFPRVDRDMFDLQLWNPAGTSLSATRETTREVEKYLRSIPGADGEPAVSHIHWLAGATLPSVYYNLVENADGRPEYARAVVVTRSAGDVKPLLAAAGPALDDAFPDSQIVVDQFAQGPPVDAPVLLKLYRPDVRTLQNLGEEVRRAVQRHPKVVHARTTLPRGVPKLWLDADEDAARLAGFSLADLADRLRADLDGATAGTILEDTEELPVRVRAPAGRRGSPAAVAAAAFALPPDPGGFNNQAEWVPLAALGALTLRPGTGGITREDGRRANFVKGYVVNDALPIEVTNAVLADLDAAGFALPAGYGGRRVPRRFAGINLDVGVRVPRQF